MRNKVKLFRNKEMLNEWQEKLGLNEECHPIVYTLYVEVFKEVIDHIYYRLGGRVFEVQLNAYLQNEYSLTERQARSFIENLVYYRLLDTYKTQHHNILQLTQTMNKGLGKRISNRTLRRLKFSAMRAEYFNRFSYSHKTNTYIASRLEGLNEGYDSLEALHKANIFPRKMTKKGDIYILYLDILCIEVPTVEAIKERIEKAQFSNRIQYDISIYFYSRSDKIRFSRSLERKTLDLFFIRKLALESLDIERLFIPLSDHQKQFQTGGENNVEIIKDIEDYQKGDNSI